MRQIVEVLIQISGALRHILEVLRQILGLLRQIWGVLRHILGSIPHQPPEAWRIGALVVSFVSQRDL